LVVLIIGLFLAAVAQHTIGGAEEDIISWFNRLPDRTVGVVIGTGQFIIVAVPLAVWGLLLWRRHFRLLGMQWIAGLVASWAITFIESQYSDRIGVIEETHSIHRGWITDATFPTSSAIAASAAFVVVTAPWLSRRWRRATWTVLTVLVLLRIVGSGEPPVDIIVAVAMGMVAGSLALLVFGSPNPFPRATELLAELRTWGLTPTGIVRATGHDSTPDFLVETADPERSLFVKVRTPDDRSSDLLDRMWGSVRLRSSEVERPFSSLKRRSEHEAFATIIARDRGATVPDIVGLGETEHGSVFIAYVAVDGTPIANVEPVRITDTVLDDLWSEIAAFRSARLAHRNLALSNVMLDNEGRLVIIDFGRASIAATDRELARDIAELLVSLSALIGVEQTVSTAVDVLGSDAVAECLPQLQPLALAPDVRSLAKKNKGLLDEISLTVRDVTGAPEVQLEKLERIKLKTVLMIVAGSLAFYALLPQLANISETTDALGNANLWWLPAILVASASTYIFATVSALGAYSLTLPILATLRSQLASSFTALVAPANAGGMALGVRFLQKAGFKTAAASSAVGLNGIGGIVVHVALLFAFVSWTGQTGVGDFSLPDTSTALVVIVVILVLSTGLLLIKPIRRRVLGPIVSIVKSAGGHVGTVFSSPARVLALFGGSMLVTLAYAATLVFSVEAFGAGLSIPEICTAYMVAVTIATIAPTPGGLGALEATMIAALAGFGMDHGPAVGAVLTFRLATFWLPILPGWYTFIWMERNGEL
jgi:undecaprenyl-diphosphatase